MSWILLVIMATLLDSARIFVDNYSSDVYFKGRGAVAQKLFYGYGFVLFAFVLMIVTGFDFGQGHASSFLLFMVSGLLASFAGIPYYKALEIDDSTNIGIFTQLAPVLYSMLGWVFLDEVFSPFQLVAFLFIVAAPILIVATTKKRSRKMKLRAVMYASLYVLIAVMGNLLFVKENTTELNFLVEIAFALLGKGIGNLVIVYSRPELRRRFHVVMKQSRKKVLRPLLANSLIGGGKDVVYRLGLVAAPTAAVASAASDSAEPIVIFFMGVILTLIWPKFGREKLDKKTVMVHLAATILVVIGVIFLQM